MSNRRAIYVLALLLLTSANSWLTENVTALIAIPQSTDKTARDAMQAAHDARLAWIDFPGFTADIRVQTDGVAHCGSILVTDDFDYELWISDDAIQLWVNSKLRSVIGHRRRSSCHTLAVRLAVPRSATNIS